MKGHARWKNPEFKPRMDGTQFSLAQAMDYAISAWVADVCNRVPGQELSGAEGKPHDVLATNAAVGELDAGTRSGVHEPFKETNITNVEVNTTRVLTWKLLGGTKGVKARLVAKGYQDPELRDGIADALDALAVVRLIFN